MRKLATSIVAGGLVLALSLTALAGSGDIAVFTEATGNETITTAIFDHTWDTVTRNDSATYTLVGGAGGSDIQLGEAGHYLVMYSSRFDDQNGGNSSNQRVEIQSQLSLAGSDLPIGWSQGFIRGDSGVFETVTSGGGIINASAGDALLLKSFRTDSTTAGNRTIQRDPGNAGIQLLKLDDGWDYLSLSSAGNQSGPTNETFIDVTYDTQNEVDAGSFGHTAGSGDITLKAPGHYLVFANTYFGRGDNTTRSNYAQQLTLNGSVVQGSLTTVYQRGNESTTDGAASVAMIIEATSADSILNVEVAKDDGSNPTLQANKTAVTIVKLPDTGDYVRLSDSTNQDLHTGSATPLTWDTEDELDTGGFTHAGSQIGAAETDDYLFLNAFADQSGAEAQRAVPWVRWRENGATFYSYAATTTYHRNSGGSQWAGNWAGLLLGMDAGDYIEATTEKLGTNSGTMTAEQKGLQGVRLGSLFALAMLWDGTDPGAWMSNHWSGNTPVGGEDYIVNSGKVEVQSDPPTAGRLTIGGGEVEIQAGWTLNVTTSVNVNGGTLDAAGQLNADSLAVAAGGTLELAGTVDANSVTTGGTNTIASTAVLDVADAMTVDATTLDMNGGALTIASGGALTVQNNASLDMNAGALTAAGTNVVVGNETTPGDTSTLTIDAGLAVASLTLRNGGALVNQGHDVTVTGALTLAGSDLDMTGALLTTTGADVTIGSTLTVDNQALEAANLYLGGALVRTGANRDVTVTESLTLAGSDLDMTGHTLTATGAAITVKSGRTLTTDNAPLTARLVDLSDGGTLDTSGDTDLILSEGLKLSGVGYTLSDGPSFTAAWDNAAAKATQITLSGGTMTVAAPGLAVPAGATMYYSFDDPCDPFRDGSAGGGHSGTVMGTAPAWTAGGQVGGAAAFDGNDTGLRPENWGFMEDPADRLSIGMWFNQDSNTSGNDTLVDEGGSTNGLGIVLDEGVLRAAVRSSGTSDVDVSSGAALAGWHHMGLVFGRTGGLLELYLDGALVDSNTFGLSTIANHTDDPGIGYTQGSNPISSGYYWGLMDELYYYERALTGAEMAGLYGGAATADLTDVDVLVTSDSNMTLATPTQLGDLTIDGDRTFTLAGEPVSFNSTTLVGSPTAVEIGSSTQAHLTAGAGLDAGGGDVAITKSGPGEVILSRASNVGAGSRFVVADGLLVAGLPAALASADVELAGGGLLLSSQGGAVTYDNAVLVTGDASITAGKSAVAGGVDGPTTVALGSAGKGLAVGAGATVTLRSTDGYTLGIAGTIDDGAGGTGGNVAADRGPVNINSADLTGLSVSGTGEVGLGTDVTVTNLTARNDSIHAGANRVTVREGGTFNFGTYENDSSTYTATTGSFQATGDITKTGADKIILGGPGSVLNVSTVGAAPLIGASIGDDLNTNFPNGGSMLEGHPAYSLTASGNDIWGRNDGAYFAYQEFDAGQPIDISARVGVNGFQGGNNGWRKAGLMIRNSLDPNSRNGFTLIAESNGNGINAQVRPSDDVNTIGATATGPRTNHDTPAFLRLTYEGDGNTFSMYYKDHDEDPWALIGTNSLDVEMTGTIYAGLAVTSHNTSQQTTVDFDYLRGFQFGQADLTPINDLTGEGTVIGDLLINGELAPGQSLGTVLSDSVTFADGSTYAVEVAGNESDLLAITGDLTIGTDGLVLPTLSLLELAPPTATSYVILTWTGSRSGEFDPALLPPNYWLEYLDNGPGLGGMVTLNIPEPATLALLALGGGLALMRRRRR